MRGLLISAAILSLAARAFQNPQTAASSTPAEQKCVLTGRVVNADTGEPLRKATLHLMPLLRVSDAAPQMYTEASEADGSFRFENLEPGTYSLSGERRGFLNSQYGQRNAGGRGGIINLRAGQETSNIILKLTPQAVISGKVLDEDGDPVDNVMIQVLAQSWNRGKLQYTPRGGNSTNDRGEFRIANLQPGKYYISAEKPGMAFGGANEAPGIAGKPEIQHVRTYFPSAGSIESAAVIEVKPGQDLPGMDIHLRSAQTFHVRGRIAGTPGESEQFTLNIAPREADVPIFTTYQGSVRKDGAFDMAGITPGSYTVSVMSVGNGSVRGVGRQLIEVGAGDVNDVVVSVIPPGSLSGRIDVEGTPASNAAQANLARVQISLSTDGPEFGPSPNATAAADGTFKLENVSPGKYYCHVWGGPDRSYLKSVRVGQQELLGKEIDFSQGVFGELEIVFRYGAAEVDGSAQQTRDAAAADPSGGQQTAAASIVLVPDALNADGSGMLLAGANRDGSFTVQAVPPGHYYAYAFEQLNMNQLQNPELLQQLESKGTEVEVKENDKKQLQLSIISSDDMQQILTKLGMAP